MGARQRRVDVVLIGAGGKTFLVRFGNRTGGLDPPKLGSHVSQIPHRRLVIYRIF
jgi:hypothetical protein